jgi:hypothetical protein
MIFSETKGQMEEEPFSKTIGMFHIFKDKIKLVDFKKDPFRLKPFGLLNVFQEQNKTGPLVETS